MPPHTVFATGVVKNHPDDIYMVNTDINREMIWIAKRGGIEDWAIYIHWADNGIDYVKERGDKITSEKIIRRLVPCDDEAFGMYRY